MTSRRDFLKSVAGTGLLSCWAAEGARTPFSPVRLAEASVTPELVQLHPAIEPIVRLIERTPREQCLDMMVEQLQRGLPFRQFLAALFLAGIRNVNPQPPGFKFHCVFAIHSAHQISLDVPVGDRLLPLFWALDNFKASQQKDVDEGDFQLRPVTGSLPSSEQAWDEFHAAMADWDEERADRAIVSLVRHRGAHEIVSQLWKYGARDYRNIGHKIIFVANSWRTLQTIGWHHAEPVLRSLVLGLLDFGKSERVNEYAFADQSYEPNVVRARDATPRLPTQWTGPARSPDSARGLVSFLRTANLNDVCESVAQRLIKGDVRASDVWDAIHLTAGELMMQQPGIYGIHTVTSMNAMRFAFETAADLETRLLLLLQGVGWMRQFRHLMGTKPGGLKDVDITKLSPAPTPDEPEAAVEEIFSLIGNDAPTAAAKAMMLAGQTPESESFARRANQLVVRKGTDAHDYKYPVAIFEDSRLVSSEWRPHMLATAVYNLRGLSEPDSALMQRAAAIVRSV